MSKPINIIVHGVKNFTPGITSGVVSLTVQYSKVIIDESPDNEDNRTVTTDIEANELTVVGFDT